MKSRTKNRLSEEKIRELVRIHFGQDCKTGKITELKGGMFNAIYRIERIKEKDAIILKVGVIPGTTLLTYERDIMPVEVECYRMIREQTTVPVPEVLAYDFSKKHISSNYFFMTELTGVTFSSVMKKMSQENVDLIREELAGYLYQLHGIKGKYFGYFTEDKSRQYSSWTDAFWHMFHQILSDSREHGVRLPYQQMQAALRKHLECLEDVKEPSLVEYDCHEGNISCTGCIFLRSWRQRHSGMALCTVSCRKCGQNGKSANVCADWKCESMSRKHDGISGKYDGISRKYDNIRGKYNNTEDKRKMMEEMPIARLLWKMSGPFVIGVMAYNLYNVFDTVFVSHGAGTDAVGGVAVSFPLFIFLSAVSSTLGSGAASVISRALGERDNEKAAKAAANTFLMFYTTAGRTGNFYGDEYLVLLSVRKKCASFQTSAFQAGSSPYVGGGRNRASFFPAAFRTVCFNGHCQSVPEKIWRRSGNQLLWDCI